MRPVALRLRSGRVYSGRHARCRAELRRKGAALATHCDVERARFSGAPNPSRLASSSRRLSMRGTKDKRCARQSLGEEEVM